MNKGQYFIFAMAHSGGDYLTRLIEGCCKGTISDVGISPISRIQGFPFSAPKLSGLIWDQLDGVNSPDRADEVMEHLRESLPQAKIVLLTRDPQQCAESIVENWDAWIEKIAEHKPHRAAEYNEVQTSTRIWIALCHAMAQGVAIAKLFTQLGTIPITYDLLAHDPEAALRSIGLEPTLGTAIEVPVGQP